MKRIVFVALFMSCLTVLAQPVTINGTIFNKNNEPVKQANVKILNTDFVALSDDQGNFKISGFPSGEYTMQVSALGYANYTQKINFDTNRTGLSILLTAQDFQLNEVIVTAQKREEKSKDLPLSISTLSSEQILNQRILNTKDLSAVVPNLYSGHSGDNRNVASIRGIATTSYDQAVATYVDGVSQFGLDTYIAQLNDVERIEVLRGPQGTLYGRNAMGGVINIITKQPGNETSGSAGVEFGNYNQQRLNFAVRTPLLKDKLFFGAAGLYTQSDGFYTNQFNNSNFDLQNSFTGNYYLKFLATPRLSFTLNVKNNANRNNGPFALAGSKDQALDMPFMVNQNAVTNLVDNTLNSSLSVNYAANSFNLTSQTAYQSNYRYYVSPIDGDFSPIDGVAIVNNYGDDWNKVKVVTQEFRISSPASTSKIKWVGGVYGFYQDNPVKQGTYFGADAAMVGAPFPDFTSLNTNKGESYGTAVFGTVNYRIFPKINIGAGLRYDYEHKKQSVLGEFVQAGQSAITRPDTSSTASFNALSPRIDLSYYLSDNHHLFTSYSRGFRAGGISQLSSDPSQPPLFNYEPEYSDNVEIGIKNILLNNRLTLNATYFYTEINDVQIPELILPDAITVTRNAGQVRSRGFELELAAIPLKGLEVNWNFGYTDAEYTKITAGAGNTIKVSKGNKQIFTPETTSLLALQYGHDLSETKKIRLILRGDWRHFGKQYFDTQNNISQNAFSLLNTRAGVSTRTIDVFLWASNLADKKYIEYAYDFGASHLGNPRTYGISLLTRF